MKPAQRRDKLPKLPAEATACYFRIRERLRAMGKWDDDFAAALLQLSLQATAYMRIHAAFRMLQAAGADREVLDQVRERLEEARMVTRHGLAAFLQIPPRRVPFALLDADGTDRDIVDLCHEAEL